MKKTIIFFSIFILILLFSLQCTPPGGGGSGGGSGDNPPPSNLPWPKRLGGNNGTDIGYGITADNDYNIIITGFIGGNSDLNGDGDFLDGNGESAAGYGFFDIAVAKFSNSGTFLWSKRLGGIDKDQAYSVTNDNLNNIIITGFITGDVDLNMDGDILDSGESGTGYGDIDIIVTKLDSDGNYLWSRRIGGTEKDLGFKIKTDGFDNIFVTGFINDNCDFNGDGDYDEQGESASGYNYDDSFLVKFNSGGEYQWSKRIGGSSEDRGYSLSIDSDNNILLTGATYGNSDLDGDGTTESSGFGLSDIYISKFNNTGDHIWTRRMGGTDYEYSLGIAVDANNNLAIIGRTSGDSDFNNDGDMDDDGESASGYGDVDIFIVKFDSSGSYQWSKRLGGAGRDIGNEITFDSDANANIIVTGYIYHDADLNGDGDRTDGGAESYDGYDSYDLFIVKFSSTGIHQWSKRLGGLDLDEGNDIVTDNNNNIFIAGQIWGNVDLNGDKDQIDGYAEIGNANCERDILILKLDKDGF